MTTRSLPFRLALLALWLCALAVLFASKPWHSHNALWYYGSAVLAAIGCVGWFIVACAVAQAAWDERDNSRD